MKIILALVLLICIINVSAIDGERPYQRPLDLQLNRFKQVENEDIRNSRSIGFSLAPVEVGISWYDYMMGGYNNVPLRNQPELADPYGYPADGKYAVFMGKENSGSLRRVYYVYLDNENNISTPSLISSNSVYEGYPGIGIDPVTANPFVAWHSVVETDGSYDSSMSYDMFNVIGSPGLWSQPFIVVDNPEIGFPLTGNDNDAFIWPQVWIGPSPMDGYRRLHLYANNAAGYNGVASMYNCIYGYADYQYNEANFDMDMTEWTYQTFELFDYWQYNNIKRAIKDMVVSDDGQVAIIGHAEDEFFLYHSVDYGETFELHTTDAVWPVFNPQNQDGTYYFTDDDGSPSEMFIGPNSDGGHFNVLFSEDNSRIVYMTAFGLNSVENQENNWYFPALFHPKIVYYDLITEEFGFVDLQIAGANPNDDQPMIPYDLNEDGEVDSWDEDGLVEFAMCWPSHYFAGDYQTGSFSESCFKLVQNREMNMMAAIFMDGRFLMEAYYENPEYQGWEEKAQIAISLSFDDGLHWSDPYYLNGKEDDENYCEELDGMLPCYVYPADEIDIIDNMNYRIPVLFYDDFSYGSFAGNGEGQDIGGSIMYAELLFSFTETNDDTIIPSIIKLGQNYPNPFNPSTTISFELSHPRYVELTIYNIKGQHIRTLSQQNYNAGTHNVLWNGRDDRDQPVNSGIYLYKLRAGSEVVSRKMILAK